MKRARWLSLLLVAACLSGCGPHDKADPRRGGTLHLAARDAPSLDPYAPEDPWSIPFRLLAYEGLVRFDTAGTGVRPAHAERWEVSSDGLAYTFYLHKGRRYEGGTAIAAADYARAFRTIFGRRPLSPGRARFACLAGATSSRFRRGDPELGVEAPDSHTVVFRLRFPDPRFLEKLASASYAIPLPARGGAVEDLPPPSGPYRFEMGERHLTFARNPDYGGEEPAFYDTIVVRLGTSTRSAVHLLTSAHIDVLWPEPVGHTARLQREGGLVRVAGSGTSLAYLLVLNGSLPPTSRGEVRRAISYALDRSDLPSPWRAWDEIAYGSDAIVRFPGPDPETVRSELAAARLVRGLTLPLTVARDSDEEALATVLVPGLARAGVHAELRAMRRGEKQAALARRAGFLAALWGIRSPEAKPIPWDELLLDRALDPSWGGNLAHFFQGGEMLDTLLVRAAFGGDDTARRRVVEWLRDGGPLLPLARRSEAAWVRPEVRGLVLHGVYGPLWGGAWQDPKSR